MPSSPLPEPSLYEINKEFEDLEAYKPGVVVAGKWRILERLDEGIFGKVFRVQLTTATPPLYAALKVESVYIQGRNAIKLEKAALERIHKNGLKEHVPELYQSNRKKNICYMIMTLLGSDLERIKERYYPDGYPLKVWIKVAVQSLYAIKTVHDAGFVHRDIMPANFVFGHPNEPKRARVLYIIDFGIARQYAIPDPKKPLSLRPCTARARIDFRGRWYFASPAMHDYVELGRKDDLWSWLFMLIELYAELPWTHLDSCEQIGMMKQAMRDEELVTKMPREFISVPRLLRSLTVYNRPDYRAIYDCLEKIFVRCKASWSEPYPWETKEMVEANQAAMPTAADSYLDPVAFFTTDPIGIDVGPSKFGAKPRPDNCRSFPPTPTQAPSSDCGEKTPEKRKGFAENIAPPLVANGRPTSFEFLLLPPPKSIMRRTVNKKSPAGAIGEPIATSTPKASELTKRRVGGANGANGTTNGTTNGTEKRGKQVDEKPQTSSVSSSSPSMGRRLVKVAFLMFLLLLVLVFTTIVLFERQESATFVESQPWLVNVRRAYYEPIKEVALQKYSTVFAR